MAMNKKIIMAIALGFTLILAGCESSKPADGQELDSLKIQLSEKEEIIEGLNTQVLQLETQILETQNNGSSSSLSTGPVPGDSLIKLAVDVVELLKDNNFSDLGAYVHPNNGLRFSPYSYIDIENDQVFQASQFQNLSDDSNIYAWGNYDGSGFPINLTFEDYYQEFIYNEDFANPHMYGNNYPVGSGNMINNFSEVYTNGSYIEFYFTGFDPQFEGIDWTSLTLGFEEYNNIWYLVGVIHGQWTT